MDYALAMIDATLIPPAPEAADKFAELSDAHAQLRHLLDCSPTVIYSLKVGGKQVISCLVSENISLLLGFTASEAPSYDWWLGQLHPEDRDRAVASVAECLAHGTSEVEYRLRHKDGSYRWVSDNRRLICDSTGELEELVGAWTDITEKKEWESHLLRAQRMKNVGRLASGIAHDMNNILAPIMMCVPLLRKGLMAGDAERFLGIIETSARRGAYLVKQLLFFSRDGDRVQSELGRESSARIELPAVTDSEEPASEGTGASPPPGRNETLLIVDDEDAIRDLAGDLLVRHGYKVVAAENGAEGAAAFAAHADKIKLVLTDLDMPVMDGVSLIKLLKNANPRIRIIVSTGLQNARQAQDGSDGREKLDGVAFLHKPYTVGQLLNAVHEELACC